MLISLLVMPLGIGISMTVGKKVHILQKAANDLWDKIFGRFGDGLTNIGITKLYAREQYEGEIVGKMIDTAADRQFHIRKIWCFLNS